MKRKWYKKLLAAVLAAGMLLSSGNLAFGEEFTSGEDRTPAENGEILPHWTEEAPSFTDASETAVMKADQDFVDFGSCPLDSLTGISRYVKFSVQGNGECHIRTLPECRYFEFLWYTGQAAGEGEHQSFYLKVRPKADLLTGTYEEQAVITTVEGASCAISLSIVVESAKFQNLIETSPAEIDFGKLFASYPESPEEKKIMVKNVGTEEAALFVPEISGLDIKLSGNSVLHPGESTAITVAPALGLKPGEHVWWVNLRAQSTSGKSSYGYCRVDFQVDGKNFEGMDGLSPITELLNGTEKSVSGLRLPKSISLNGADGETFLAGVDWNLEECTYDPACTELQEFTVKGKLRLPDSQNNHNYDTTVEQKVSVNPYEALSRPEITSVKTTNNSIKIILFGKSTEAQGYQYVLVRKEEELEQGKYMAEKTSEATGVTFTYVPKGSYLIYCRAFKKEGEEAAYGRWSLPKKTVMEVKTPDKPAISRAEVRSCDVRLSIRSSAEADGFDAVLARKVTDGVPSDIASKQVNCKQEITAVTFSQVPAGTYYAAVHAYIRQNGVKIFSPWCEYKKVVVKYGRVTAVPVIKKTVTQKNKDAALRNLTVTCTLPKGIDGVNWVLSKSCKKDAKGKYVTPYNHAYTLKDQKKTTVIFQGIAPGTYYLAGRAYQKGFAAYQNHWSAVKVTVIK